MYEDNKRNKSKSSLYRVIAATLTIGGVSLLSPMLALALTAAGTPIKNTATGTYEDPNAPGTQLNTTSNEVTVTVAEVAGITVVASGVPVDSTPADAIKAGDTLTYTFTITNVGNDPTKFRVPNLATTTGPASVTGNLQYFNGTTWVDITGTELITASNAVGGTLQVRVNVLVTAGAVAGNVITVRLGNTPANSQNIALVNDGGDVFTVDNPNTDPAPEITGVPVNGEREASFTQQSTVGAVVKNLALATLLKTRGAYTNVDPATTLIGDKVDYTLSLRVENTDVPLQGITPQPLAGYAGISVNGATATDYILISDVIPTGTVLSTTPTAPAGWEAVYSTIDATTTPTKPNSVLWTKFATTAPTTLSAVKRVGFVKSTSTATDYIPVGTTVTGFSIQVAVGPTEPAGTLSVNNIAQVVGQTPNAGPSVYDESGDQNPNNYSGAVGSTMTPGSTDTTPADGVPDNGVGDNTFAGVADPATQGTDASNTNAGDGSAGGEANVLVLNAPTATSILNGPLNAASATGPDGTTATDFSNKSSLIPANTAPGSKIDPAAVSFGNTIQNNGTASGTITIVPTALTNKLDLPDATTVTITYQGQTASYTYNQATGSFGTPTAGTAISIPNVAAGAPPISYGVEVNLPAGTKLSTDTLIDYAGDTEWGYPVPITATVTAGTVTASNITIDRVYTGFLQLLKVSRILQGSGSAVVGTQGSFESTPSVFNGAVEIDPNPSVAGEPRNPTPGNIIEYQIRYKNISSVQAGTGNVILNADKLVITEDGTTGTNNWALLNTFGVILTSNVTNPQAVDSNSGTVVFSPSGNQSGTTQATDVTKYVDSLTGLVIPQGQGTFTFQRKLN